ncbi:MAG: hypothetical protein MJ252_05415 [archaeon]|nr:hypothetical protein [archaeon]
MEKSQKIITKLKEEYTKLIKEYKSIEDENRQLENKNLANQKLIDSYTKAQGSMDKTQKQNDQLRMDLEKAKKEASLYKGNLNNKVNDFNKKEKEIKEKDLLIMELKNSGNKFINMIKDRENLIQSYTAKIEELTAAIAQKDEQLKLMVNFSKEISKENKTNVQELTKQAVKTIKIFYNTLNNNNINGEQGGESGGILEIKPTQNEEDFIKELETSLSKGKTRLLLQDSLNKALFIPPSQKFISKEFLIDNNLKSNLVKLELFSSLLREFHFVDFLKDLFSKIAPKSSEEEHKEEEGNPESSLEQLVKNVIAFKTTFDFVIQENERLLKDNKHLLAKEKETELYISKLKDDLKKYAKRMNDKLEFIDKSYADKNKELKDEISFLKSKGREESDANKDELKKLRLDNDKINNINLNLNNALVDRDNIILQLQQDNNNLIKELTNLKTKLNELERGKSNQNNSNTPNDNPNTSRLRAGRKKDDKDNTENDSSYLSRAPEERKTYVITNSNNGTPNNSSRIREGKGKNSFIMENPERFSYEITSQNYGNVDGNCQFCSRNNALISDYINSVPFQNFNELVKCYLYFPNELNNLFSKVDDINRNILDAKNNLERGPADKKIKVSHMIDIIDQIQKLLSYLSQKINKANIDFSNKGKDFSETAHFISALCFNNRNDYEKELQRENSLNRKTFEINLNLSNASSPNNFSNRNQNQMMEQEEEQYQGFPIEEIRQFFEINVKIFSSAELMKFYSIYDGHNIEEILQIFGNNCGEIKEAISKMTFAIETDTSELDEADVKWNKKNRIGDGRPGKENNAYKIVNEKILSLKRFEFNFSIQMELLKNYLIALEMVLKHIQPDIENESNINPEELRGRKNIIAEAINHLYGIFEEVIFYKIDEMEDDIIFNRKIVTRLLFNHKQYLFIVLDF